MKQLTITAAFLVLCFQALLSQPYHNEWIDHGSTYHKIKVPRNGLYRIPFATLQAAGLPPQPEGYRLYRNGEQVPLFASASPNLAPGDFIEFYGEKNDGAFDTQLYEDPQGQANPQYSLFNDTATYFLTWAAGGGNPRYTAQANDLGNPPAAEPYCWHQTRTDFKNQATQGTTYRLDGQSFALADYTNAEGFASASITESTTSALSLQTPSAHTQPGLNARLTLRILGLESSGALADEHTMDVAFNGAALPGPFSFNGQNVYELAADIPSVQINASSSNVSVHLQANALPDFEDAVAVASMGLRYPHQFDFDAQRSLLFEVGNNGEKYLEITNFIGGTEPVIYDLTNKTRLNVSPQAGTYRVLLPPGTTADDMRKLFVANTSSSLSLHTISSMETVNFIDFSLPENQGDYIIIAHPSMAAGAVDQLEAYANYRSGTQGGGHLVQTVLTSQLYDQFAYGIAKHPLAIRNFINLAVDSWTTLPPAQLLLIGKGVAYSEMRGDATAYSRCLVPTYGSPPSDNLLTAHSATDTGQRLAVGRIPASNAAQLGVYLQKVMEYENYDGCTAEDRLWRKRAFMIGAADDAATADTYSGFLEEYAAELGGEHLGSSTQKLALDNAAQTADFPTVAAALNAGVNVMVYFGQSGGSEWRMDAEPAMLENGGRYPFMVSATQGVGNINTKSLNLMPGNFLFEPQKGAIGFWGITAAFFETPAHFFNLGLSNRLSTEYGNGLGDLILETNGWDSPDTTPEAQAHRLYVQTNTLAGDPALNVYPGPDTDPALTTGSVLYINPSTGEPIGGLVPDVTYNMEEFGVKVTVYNAGKYRLNDSLNLQLSRILPGGGFETVLTDRVEMPAYSATHTYTIANNRPETNGLNTFLATLDSGGELTENCESNNTYGEVVDMTAFCTDFPIVELGDSLQTLPEDGSPIWLDAGTGNPSDTYYWTTGETVSTILVDGPGSYTVTVTNADGCPATDHVAVTLFNGVDAAAFPEVEIYPNPTSGLLFIGGLPAETTASLYNANGQLLLTNRNQLAASLKIDLSGFAKGVYLLHLENKNGRMASWVLVE